MKQTTFQHPELRDANDNIIQEGTYGKESPLVNSDNTGVLDYINNNLEALHDAQTAAGNAITTGGLTVSGKTTTGTLEASSATVTGDLTVTGTLDGTASGNLPLSGGSITGDVDITGDLSVSGAITGNVLTYKKVAYKEDSQWEDNSIQSIASAFPDDHPNTYPYGVKVTLGKVKNAEGNTRIYFPHNGGMYLKNCWNGNANSSGWLAMLNDQNFSQFALPKDGTAVKATADAAGNNIQTTYAKKSDLANYLPLSGGTVTGSIQYVDNGKVFAIGHAGPGNVDLGWNWFNREGAGLGLRSTDFSSPGESPGEFTLFARDANNTCSLTGKPDGTLTWNTQPLLPVGIVQAFAGSTIPTGWLLCDGSAVSRTTYANLYACIGTTYGAGNGSTTFNLPDLVDKFVEGSATSGTVKSAGLPNITGILQLRSGNAVGFEPGNDINGAFSVADSTRVTNCVDAYDYGQAWFAPRLKFSAHDSSSIYGNSDTVQPPALTMRYIIKY